MKRFQIALLLFFLARTIQAASFTNDFVVVFIDADTEARLGDFPFDRAVIAKAIMRANTLKARGVVLKFFFDQPRTEPGDTSLSRAMTNIPVILQAGFNSTEIHSNPLPKHFVLSGVKSQSLLSGKSGWIPLPVFAAHARDIGFVDTIGVTNVPLVESYQSQAVKSLVLCCLEMATGERATIQADRVMFGSRHILMDAEQSVPMTLPEKDTLSYIPFHRFLDGETPASWIQEKIVIIGYDGPKIHSLGGIRAHRFFIYSLASAYAQLKN